MDYVNESVKTDTPYDVWKEKGGRGLLYNSLIRKKKDIKR